MPTNMNQLISIMKSGNPQQIVMNMLQEKAQQGNPMFSNLLGKVQSGDTEGIENIAKNIAKEKGIDFDKEFNSFKRMFGL